MPSWLSFAPATKIFSGTPPQTIATRTYTIGVTATDTGGLSASTTFKISVKGSSTGGGGIIQVEPGDLSEQQFVQDSAEVDGVQAEPLATQVALAQDAQDAWYAYDKLNRVAVNNGMLSGGQVVLKQGDNSYSISYDAETGVRIPIPSLAALSARFVQRLQSKATGLEHRQHRYRQGTRPGGM